MDIRDIPTKTLKVILRRTELKWGKESQGATFLRQELEKRDHDLKEKK